MVHRWHLTTTLTKCVVVWCCGCCFEYPQTVTTTHFNKIYVLLNGVVGRNTHNTIQQHILLKCVVVRCCGCCFEYPQQHILTKCVLWCCGCYDPQHHSTTHFVKMCCCGYSKQHPQHHTTTHFAKMCCCGYSKQHHTATHFINVVVVCHLWWCGCCFEYPQFTHTSLCCCCVSPMMMWVLFRVPTVYTHITFNNTLC